MSKFRKRPVVIDAVRWTGSNEDEMAEFVGDNGAFFGNMLHANLMIRTLEGNKTAVIGDWIIRGVKGEFYPCKPNIFEQTYEPVRDDGEVR